MSVICPHGEETLVVADYLAGRLSRAEASVFEGHAFGCDRCFEELQRAAELRAAVTGERLAAAVRAARPGALSRPALALAAAVLLAVGMWFARPFINAPDTATDPVYRDSGDATRSALALDIARDEDQLAVSWEPVHGADQYEIRVFTAAGDPVFEQQSSATSIDLSAAGWPESAATGQHFVQVIALDELRRTIVESDFEPL